MKIGLLSDTHGYFEPGWHSILGDCDEIWHAGDIGDIRVSDGLRAWAPLVACHGNIDDAVVRAQFPEHVHFEREGVRIWLTHILSPQVKKQLKSERPDLLVFGHSHVLKAERDKQGVFLLNPGACGRQGFHLVKTMVTFEVLNRRVNQLRIHELGPR
ncbi:MAG: metallophosphoesterase family protein [Vulcanimicrobiota bacterium]